MCNLPTKIKKEIVISPDMDGASDHEKMDALAGLFMALTDAIHNGCSIDISDANNIRVFKEDI